MSVEWCFTCIHTTHCILWLQNWSLTVRSDCWVWYCNICCNGFVAVWEGAHSLDSVVCWQGVTPLRRRLIWQPVETTHVWTSWSETSMVVTMGALDCQEISWLAGEWLQLVCCESETGTQECDITRCVSAALDKWTPKRRGLWCHGRTLQGPRWSPSPTT
jgi:hypothetical protein